MEYNDNSIPGFGRHKFKRLREFPRDYLLRIYRNPNGCTDKSLLAYIEKNLSRIQDKSWEVIPPLTFERPVCTKIPYASESEAKAALRQIKAKDQKKKKPYRCYECPDCSHWHLTSQESRDYLKKHGIDDTTGNHTGDNQPD